MIPFMASSSYFVFYMATLSILKRTLNASPVFLSPYFHLFYSNARYSFHILSAKHVVSHRLHYADS
jgi:hypothetical protein